MADFYSATSGCFNPCCAPANTDGVAVIICCENKQPCCNLGRRRRCCKGKKHHR